VWLDKTAKVATMRSLASVIGLLLFSTCWPIRAQIIEMRTVNGKPLACTMSGLSSDLKDCGTEPDWYKYVFVGSILKMTPTDHDEQEITIVPEEVFSGSPPSPVTVMTSQWLCMRPMAVGEHWLFYLHQESGKPLVIGYGGASIPVADAGKQLETLRRLRSIGDDGLLRGMVLDGERSGDSKPIPNAQVVAKESKSGRSFIAISDKDGRYEFRPLMAGSYKISVQSPSSKNPDDSKIDVRSGQCWDLTLTRSSQALISGHIQFTSGKPASGIGIVLIDGDRSGYLTMRTNDHGDYTFNQMRPGTYIVGVNYPRRTDWFEGAGGGAEIKLPPASLFYPNSPNIPGAEVLSVGKDEKRSHIDFILPSQ